ncbi:MAG TPA: nucleotidyltransferase domain-containing protein [Thermoanaerobaculia bacterium]|jgi:predicted nucleotidyltransferase|nr:nucleotidyltransferase domain-containing protein [Thermoanaerobaculia bacterium]
MPTLDLPPDYLADVRHLLASHVPAAEVWAYGSRINGRAHEGSDLDLVVRNPEDLGRPQRDLWELREAFSESEIPILVEVFDWARIPEEFRREIARAHVVIWKGANPSPLS